MATVLFGLSGPVTQPTTEVPGGSVDCGTAAAGATAGAWAVVVGLGTGATAACLLVTADLGVSAWASSWPIFGSGAWSLAPTGLWPIGRLSGAILPGLGIWTAWFGAGWARAAAPEQPSAAAVGAVSAAHRTGTTAQAVQVLTGCGDMAHPPKLTTARGGRSE